MTTNKLKALELFAGIGGFRLGMANANIQTVWANDINELCCKVYESNFGKDSIVLGDINEISILDIPNQGASQMCKLYQIQVKNCHCE
ncbi:DNA cytosine methyltransferase [Nostoc sp.]